MSPDIVYHNEDRTEPMVLDRYIYVLVAQGQMSNIVMDSYYHREDAEAARKTKQANEMNSIAGFQRKYLIQESRLYR
jgi:hypothetical protein